MPINVPREELAVVSQSIPSSVKEGMVWYEVDASGSLVQKWNRVGQKWISDVDSYHYSTISSPTSQTDRFPLHPTHLTRLLKWRVQTYSTNNLAGNIYITHQLRRGLLGVTSEDANLTTINLNGGQVANQEVSLNITRSSQDSDLIYVNTNKSGNTIHYTKGFLFYHLIRN